MDHSIDQGDDQKVSKPLGRKTVSIPYAAAAIFGFLLFAALRVAGVYLGGRPEAFGFSDRPLIIGGKGGMTTWSYYYGLSFLTFAVPLYWIVFFAIAIARERRMQAANRTA
ncbi:MAG: hypothetical protein JNL18_10385 [Planctomycetaceae bacterium]|uniref:hypothetical protein n=1 Tax=Lacipirellula limnantheis TaxID=2528024 RepID=UPI00119FF064|nr:hypothetical protein [Lacipirellula limnantheis]MBL9163131.1 hypothetical protein [Planctomycetaceae bacterium]